MRRFGAAGLAAALFVYLNFAAASPAGATGPSSWPMSRFDAALTAFNSHEHVLGRDNLSQLRLLSTTQLLDPYGDGAPVVDAGVAYVESYGLNGSPGYLEAFSTHCAGNSCHPLWTASIGQFAGGTVAVADGEVFAGGDNGATFLKPRLYVFPIGCRTDGGTCRPLWHGDLTGSGDLQASPTVSDGVVYVPGGPPFNAYLYAFPTRCHVPKGARCLPLWRGGMDIGDVFGSVAVSDGFAYVADYDGFLYAFRTDCESASGVCKPAWSGYTNQLGPIGVATHDDLVFVGSQDGNLYAFKADGCTNPFGSCSPVWVGATGGNVRSNPAIAYGMVFVASDNGTYHAFPEECSNPCSPVWKASFKGNDSIYASPSVADGVVYFGNSDGGRTRAILAFDVHCGTGGALCSPLRVISAPTHYLFEGPAIAGGRLYATAGPEAGPGEMYVFGIPHERD